MIHRSSAICRPSLRSSEPTVDQVVPPVSGHWIGPNNFRLLTVSSASDSRHSQSLKLTILNGFQGQPAVLSASIRCHPEVPRSH